jgi:hypothetical protein
VKYRRSQKGWTDKAADLSIRELGKLHADGHDPTAVIEQSIANGWRGVFPIRNRPAPRESQADIVRELMGDAFGDAPRTGFDFDGTAQEVPNV